MTAAINEGLSYLAALRDRIRREFEERRRADREREDRIINGKLYYLQYSHDDNY